MNRRQEQLKAFERLLDIMDDLREKCPWDRKQTFDSLRQNTIEETYELATAISRHDMNEISKELGDVLLHVVFYAKMGSETGDFDIADVCNRISDKLIFRHPHVYGEAAAQSAEEVATRPYLAAFPTPYPRLSKPIGSKIRSPMSASTGRNAKMCGRK